MLAVPGSVLSHATAAAAWDLVPIGGGAIHVAVDSTAGRAGLKVHRTTLDEDERAEAQGVPVTSVERTLVDLAATAKPATLEAGRSRSR